MLPTCRCLAERVPGAMSSVPRVCSACGAASAWDARFCQQCGRPLGEDATPAVLRRALSRPRLRSRVVLLVAASIALIAGSVDRGDPAVRVRCHRLRLLLLARRGAIRGTWWRAGLRHRATTCAAGRRSRSRRSLRGVRAARDVVRLRRESRSLRREREPILRSLGDAVYREDEPLVRMLRDASARSTANSRSARRHGRRRLLPRAVTSTRSAGPLARRSGSPLTTSNPARIRRSNRRLRRAYSSGVRTSLIRPVFSPGRTTYRARRSSYAGWTTAMWMCG